MRLKLKRCLLLILCFSLVVGMLGSYPIAAVSSIEPSVSIGNNFVVALRADGSAYAWGDNTNGVFGNGSTTSSSYAVAVAMPQGVQFKQISAGNDHVIALDTNGKVWTWGSDTYGQLGNRTDANEPENSNKPKQVKGALEDKTVISVAAGNGYSMALIGDTPEENCSTIYVWGTNKYGILANSEYSVTPDTISETPVAIPAFTSGVTISKIIAGPTTAAAIDSAGQVYLWGDNQNLQVGSDTDVKANGQKPFKKTTTAGYFAETVSIGSTHNLFLMNDGTVAAMGNNKKGQFGSGTTSNSTAIFKYPTFDEKIIKVAAGGSHSVVLSASKKVYVFGDNQYSQLGLSSNEGNSLTTPTELAYSDAEDWGEPVFVAAGYNNSAVINEEGYIFMFGDNSCGQLGDDSAVQQSTTPVRVYSAEKVLFCLGAAKYQHKQEAAITVNATVPQPTFTVNIPSTIAVGTLKQKFAGTNETVKSKDFTVSVTNINNLFGEKQIEVLLSAEGESFLLSDGVYTLEYQVYDAETGGNKVAVGDIFAVFTEDGTTKGRIDIDQSQITRKGEYSGTVIFTVRVTEITTQEG